MPYHPLLASATRKANNVADNYGGTVEQNDPRKIISPRRQGAKIKISSEFSELGVFAPLREIRIFCSR
jgi:hypothetical protein